MATSIKGVTRLAGVSVATASSALKGHANVTAPTRAHAMGVVARLRFVPSSAAHSMIRRHSHTICALLPNLHLQVSSSHGDAAEAAAALRAMNGRVDGLLVMSSHVSAEFLWGNVADDLPAVLINEAGVRVPTDIALAGFDDIPMSRCVNPLLTTVRARIADTS